MRSKARMLEPDPFFVLFIFYTNMKTRFPKVVTS